MSAHQTQRRSTPITDVEAGDTIEWAGIFVRVNRIDDVMNGTRYGRVFWIELPDEERRAHYFVGEYVERRPSGSDEERPG